MMASSKLKLKYEVQTQIGAFFTGKSFEVSQDGTQLVCDCRSSIKFVDVSTGQPSSKVGKALKGKKFQKLISDEEEGDVKDAFKNAKIELSDNEDVSSMKISPDGTRLLVATKALLLKLYSLPDRELLQQFRSFHRAPPTCLDWDASSTMVATGSPDHSIRVWDTKHYCSTHSIRLTGENVKCVSFHPMLNKHPLLYAGVDNTLMVWRLTAGSAEQIHSISDEHYMGVTCLAHDKTGRYLVSGSLDGILVLWESPTMVRLRTVAMKQAIGGLAILPQPCNNNNDDEDGLTVMLGGETGHLSIRYLSRSKEKELLRSEEQIVLPPPGQDGGLAIDRLQYHQALDSVIVTSYDKNIFFVKQDNLRVGKLLCGNNGDILSTIFVTYDNKVKQTKKSKKKKKKETETEEMEGDGQIQKEVEEEEDVEGNSNEMLVVATNSHEVRLYRTSDMSAKLLRGHQSTVMMLAKHPNMTDVFASCSQDGGIRVWRTTSDCSAVCVAVADGHSMSVNAVTFGADVMFSCGKDTCLKRWLLSEDKLTNIKMEKRRKWSAADDKLSLSCIVSGDADMAPNELVCDATQAGHEGTVNCVAVSPRDRLVASGSDDKTVKVWSGRDLSLVGTLRGHKRSVWSVKFSPVDKLLASASADTTIKIWLLDSMTLAGSLNSHGYGLLTVAWINNGLQLLSTSSNGLLNLWEAKSLSCVNTIAGHAERRVWAADVKDGGDRIVTGGEDSNIVIWKDVTQLLIQQETEKKQREQSAQQALANLLQAEDWRAALALTLRLDQPYNALKVIRSILRSKQHRSYLTETVTGLKRHHLGSLVKYATEWNTRNSTCHEARAILKVLITTYLPEELEKIPFWDSSQEALLSYMERHYKRAVALQQDVMIASICRGVMEMRHGLWGANLPLGYTKTASSEDKTTELEDFDELELVLDRYARKPPTEEKAASSEDDSDSESDDDYTAEEKDAMKKLVNAGDSDDEESDMEVDDVDNVDSDAQMSDAEDKRNQVDSDDEEITSSRKNRKLTKRKLKNLVVEDLDTGYVRERPINPEEEEDSDSKNQQSDADEGVGTLSSGGDSADEYDSDVGNEASYNDIIDTRGRDFDGGSSRGGRGFGGNRGEGLGGRGGFRGRGDGFRGRGDSFRGRGDSFRGRSNSLGFRGRGDGSRGRGDGSRGRGDGFRGRGEGFRGRGDGFRGRGDGFRGRGDGFRGRGDGFRGRGVGFRGRGDGFRGRGDGFRGRGRGDSRGGFRGSSSRGGGGFRGSRGRGQSD